MDFLLEHIDSQRQLLIEHKNLLLQQDSFKFSRSRTVSAITKQKSFSDSTIEDQMMTSLQATPKNYHLREISFQRESDDVNT